jgi:Beta-lactamase
VPGIVTLVSRWGEVHVEALGMKCGGGSDPVRRDTIFRIASMSKPIAAAATMILAEECKVRLAFLVAVAKATVRSRSPCRWMRCRNRRQSKKQQHLKVVSEGISSLKKLSQPRSARR